MVVVGEPAVGGRADLQPLQCSLGVCDDGIGDNALEGGVDTRARRGELEAVEVGCRANLQAQIRRRPGCSGRSVGVAMFEEGPKAVTKLPHAGGVLVAHGLVGARETVVDQPACDLRHASELVTQLGRLVGVGAEAVVVHGVEQGFQALHLDRSWMLVIGVLPRPQHRLLRLMVSQGSSSARMSPSYSLDGVQGPAVGRDAVLRWALAMVAFLAVIDLSVVAIALPAIRRDLGFSVAGVQWVMSGYALAQGGLLLVAGRFADRLGRRRVLVSGLIVFTAGSVTAAAATAPWMLVAARIMEGVGGAVMLPTALALVTANFNGDQRDRALGLFSAMSGAGFVVGVISSGVVTQYLGWRAVMLLSAPVAAALVPIVLRVVPESSVAGPRPTADVPGALALTTGVGALIFGLSRIEPGGIASPTVWRSLAISGLLLGVFVRIEWRSAAPVLPLAVFREPVLRAANTANLLKSTVGMSQLYVLTLFLQEVLDTSALRTGMLFLPMALASVAAANFAGRYQIRLGGAKATALLGCLTLFGGLLLLSTQVHPGAALLGIVTAMITIESGFMTAEVPLNLAATTSLPRQRGLAAGLLTTTTELGNALGLGLTAAVVGFRTGSMQHLPPDEALAGGLRGGLALAMTAVVIAAAVIARGLRRGRQPR